MIWLLHLLDQSLDNDETRCQLLSVFPVSARVPQVAHVLLDILDLSE